MTEEAPTLAAEFQKFAAMVFPAAPADLIFHIETAFFSGMRALLCQQDDLADACAAGLDDAAAMQRMQRWRDELEEFGERRRAELFASAPPAAEAPPLSAAQATDNEEKVEALNVYARIIQEAFAPLMAAKGKPGIVAVRTFFTMRQKDGTLSGSHTGLTVDRAEGERLKARIVPMLFGPADYAERTAIRQPSKS